MTWWGLLVIDMEGRMTPHLKLVPLFAFALLATAAEAQVRIPAEAAGIAPPSTFHVSSALAYRRSACFQERISLMQDVPPQKFYLRLLTPPDCPAPPF